MELYALEIYGDLYISLKKYLLLSYLGVVFYGTTMHFITYSKTVLLQVPKVPKKMKNHISRLIYKVFF